MRWLVAMALTWGVASRVEAAPSTSELAKTQYDEALRLSTAGELDHALDSFRRAYAIQPNPAVLFNIGQLQLAMGQPVEAEGTLRQYLRDAGATENERTREARRSLELCQRQIGTIQLGVTPEGATVFLDGGALAEGARSVRVKAGRHVVVGRQVGFEPAIHDVLVQPEAIAQLEVRLTPSVAARGWLLPSCGVPEVSLEVDGQSSAPSWGSPLPIAAGKHAIRFARHGYVTTQQVVTIKPGELTETACNLMPQDPLPRNDSGKLHIELNQSESRITLNGLPILADSTVPRGQHRLRVVRDGFLPFDSSIHVASGGETRVVVGLEPTPEKRQQLFDDARHARTVAYATGGAGLTLGAAATIAYLVASRQHDEWLERRDALSANSDAGPSPKFGTLASDAARIQMLDDMALGAALAGAALLTTSLYLFITGEDPGRYLTTQPHRTRGGITGSWHW